MHPEIFDSKQEKLFPLLKKFSKNFGLVGGTAIALQLGHRRSIDFDLFSNKNFKNEDIIKSVETHSSIDSVIVDELDQLTIIVSGVKMTFLNYPFPLNFEIDINEVILMPNLLTLAAMKAYTLGRRSKWKDYVDLYYILKSISFTEICAKAEEIFSTKFNSKLFREQLCYFEDIDFTEKIDFLHPEVTIEEIQENLIKASII